MTFLLRLCAIVLTIAILIFPQPAQAGSSSLIRAYDDQEVVSKDFSGKSLIQAQFANEDLGNSNFSNADLRGAVFNGTKLTESNWHGVDFTYGIAYLCNFTNADLTDAILVDTDMLRSNFKNAKITGADFTLAILERAQTKQLCTYADGVNSKTGVFTRESLGCN